MKLKKSLQALEETPATYISLIYVPRTALSQEKSGKSVTTKEVMCRVKFYTSTDATKISIMYPFCDEEWKRLACTSFWFSGVAKAGPSSLPAPFRERERERDFGIT